MLDRMGAESGRATSLVRYAPSSYYPRHNHPRGEEILVLSGTFSEGNEHYPEGWYLRNPPGYCHLPSSAEGAIVFVKLWQMPSNETRRVRIDTHSASSWRLENGRHICSLFSDVSETVSLQRLPPDDSLFSAAVDGAELLVLSGSIVTEDRSYARGTWIRLPAGEYQEFFAGAHGTTIYLKTGHLENVPEETTK